MRSKPEIDKADFNSRATKEFWELFFEDTPYSKKLQHYYRDLKIKLLADPKTLNFSGTPKNTTERDDSDIMALTLLFKVMKLVSEAESIIFDFNSVRTQGITVFAKMLSEEKPPLIIKKLDIRNNKISDSAAPIISNLLKKNKSITHLDICQNKGMTISGVCDIIDSLGDNDTLEKLVIGGKEVVGLDEMMKSLMSVAKTNKTLKTCRLKFLEKLGDKELQTSQCDVQKLRDKILQDEAALQKVLENKHKNQEDELLAEFQKRLKDLRDAQQKELEEQTRRVSKAPQAFEAKKFSYANDSDELTDEDLTEVSTLISPQATIYFKEAKEISSPFRLEERRNRNIMREKVKGAFANQLSQGREPLISSAPQTQNLSRNGDLQQRLDPSFAGEPTSPSALNSDSKISTPSSSSVIGGINASSSATPIVTPLATPIKLGEFPGSSVKAGSNSQLTQSNQVGERKGARSLFTD